MSRFMIIPRIDKLDESLALAREYGFGFEFNDFYSPKVLDDTELTESIIEKYKAAGLPDYCTSHGDFFDVLVFSEDKYIREISRKRIIQSLETALKIGARSVVFHTNHNPYFIADVYVNSWHRYNEEFWNEILPMYPQLNIYLENMCDSSPKMLADLAKSLCHHKNFGVCFDYAHASVFGRCDIGQWVTELAPYVKHLHINDNDLESDLHLAVGDGKIDWQRFKEYYFKYFSDKTVLIETSYPETQRRSAEYLKKLGVL